MDIAEVRSKYPQYGDVSDDDLAAGLHQKFYADLPFEDFAKKIGHKPSAEFQLAAKRKVGLAGPARTPVDSEIPPPEAPLVDTSKSVMAGMGKPQSVVRLPPAAAPKDDPSWYRADGTKKGQGFLGPLPQTAGKYKGQTSTELSVGVDIGGKQVEIPSMVPTLTPQEIQYLTTGGDPRSNKSIMRKAQDHATGRMAAGKDVFAGPGDYNTPEIQRIARGKYLTQPTTAEAAQNAMATPPTEISATPEPAPRSPSLIPAGPPGSLSYAASGAGSGIESFFSMPAALVGTGAGALGAGVAAVPDLARGNFQQATEGVRQGMAEGGQRMTLDRPIFAPTTALNQAVGDVFDVARSKFGEGFESLEELRGAVAQGIVPDWLREYVKARPEAARTLAEYGFDASIITSPVRGMQALAKRNYFPDYGPKMGRQPPPEPPEGPAPIIEGQAVRVDENAPRIPPIAPETPAAVPPAPAAPVAPAPPAHGSMGDLEAVMGSDKPLGQIRAEQVAQQAAAAAPAIQEAAQAHAEQQQVAQTANQIAMHAAGIPEAGGRATVIWPDGEIQTVTVMDPYATGAKVQMPDGQVMDLTTDDVQFGPPPAGENTPAAPIVVEHPDHIAQAGQRVDLEATDAQKNAGNYRKGHIEFQGLDVTIETPKGAVRSSIDPANPWEAMMPAHYGYLKRSEGADAENVDVYIGDAVDSDKVFIIDQIHPEDRSFDEHKIILGASSKAHATAMYHAAFSDGSAPTRVGAIVQTTMDGFKQWLKEADTTKAVAYKQPKPAAAPQPGEQHAIQTVPEGKQETVPAEGVTQVGPIDQAGQAGPPGQTQPVRQEGETDANAGRPGNGNLPVSQPGQVAVRRKLFAQWGGLRHQVDSMEDASRKWEIFRDKTGAGVSEVGNGVLVVDQDGKTVGRISYNGRMWDANDKPVGEAQAPAKKPGKPSFAITGDMVPPEVRGEPEIVARYPGEANTEIYIAKNAKGYTVGMKDLDSGDILPTLRMFEGPDALDKAKAYAESVQAKAAPAPTKGQLIPTRRPDGSIEWTTKPVVEAPAPAAEPAAESTLPKKVSREAIDKLAEKVDEMTETEKQEAAKWLDAEIQRQEEEGRRIAKECEG